MKLNRRTAFELAMFALLVAMEVAWRWRRFKARLS
jgi:hypothetical protein